VALQRQHAGHQGRLVELVLPRGVSQQLRL
jgi:hypothetical protein